MSAPARATRSARQTRSMARGTSLPSSSSSSSSSAAAKRKTKKRAAHRDEDDDATPELREADGHTVARIVETPALQEIKTAALRNLFTEVPNTAVGLQSVYTSLSQMLYGNQEQTQPIEHRVCEFIQEKRRSKARDKLAPLLAGIEREHLCHRANMKAYVMAATFVYQVNIVVFTRPTPRHQKWTIDRFLDHPKKSTFFLQHDVRSLHTTLLLEKGVERPAAASPPPAAANNHDPKEYVVERILEHYPNGFRPLKNVDFHVKWRGYDDTENTWETWDELLPNRKMHQYLQQLDEQQPKPPYLKVALNAVEKYKAANHPPSPDQEEGQHDADTPTPQIQARQKKRKNLTGRKLSVIGDVLELKGKGGVYAIMPYEQLDDKNKAIFKIGMTIDYESRLEQMHSYFPDGVYFIALLSDPKIPEWDAKKLRQWRATHDNRDPNLKEKRKQYYELIEKFLFRYLEAHKGKRIHSSTRVRHPDELKQGETEWVYTDEDTIHAAFQEAYDRYADGEGRLQQFYLQGLDPETGKEVESINELAKQRLNKVPNYTGKVIFKL